MTSRDLTDPSLDPLSAQASSPAPAAPAEPMTFVALARARAASNERRILGEFSRHEQQPRNLFGGTAHASTSDGDEQGAHAIAGPAAPIAGPAAPIALPSAAESPPTESHPHEPQSGTSPPSVFARSASFAERFTHTIPRKWSTLLSPPKANLPIFDQPSPPPRDPSTSPHRSFTSISHASAFAPHHHVPPTGAPGYASDRNWEKGFDLPGSSESTAKIAKSVQLLGRMESTIPVLSVDLADHIRQKLSALRRLAPSWTLLYSLDQHGISIATFYARLAQQQESGQGGCLLAIQDSTGALFGVWMGDGIKHGRGVYYGTGDSFLWKASARESVKVFRWTGENDYVALCESGFISFGGGDGKYGLYLDAAFLNGSSAACPTFRNEILCLPDDHGSSSSTVRFECVGLEAWSIG